ncbi:MAG: hypothetical protein KAW16_01565 [candidate division Zixibacteria bacterium]|nr:hypothetical protein [candidate division Zixibacteria bacterium]
MKGRSFQTLGFLLLFTFALFSLSQGKTLVSKNEKTLSLQDQSQDPFGLAKNDLEHYQKFSRLTNSYFVYDPESTEEKVITDVYGFKGKSVKRAFLYSLIIPGTGEFYAGSKIKAFLFFGLDVTFWSLYFNYHGKGKDKEDEYIAFADKNWNEDDYRAWWELLPDTAKEKYSHTLPDEHNQQYYEMIGKYKQFAFAWDDFDDNTAGEDSMTPYRDHYLDVREQSNSWLNKAKYSAMFSLANHILSAFDAAIAVKKYNKKGERFSQIEFKMRLTERDNEIIPKLFMSMRF